MRQYQLSQLQFRDKVLITVFPIKRAQYVLVICRRKSQLNLHVNDFFTASILSRAEQQAIFLQDRQLAFKKAALQAKTNGDMELAKKYLRMAKVGHNDCFCLPHEEPNTFGHNKDLYVLFKYTNKGYSNVVFFKQGFDQMIEAAHSGLPVDMGQVSSIFCSKSNGHLTFKVVYLVTHLINTTVKAKSSWSLTGIGRLVSFEKVVESNGIISVKNITQYMM